MGKKKRIRCDWCKQFIPPNLKPRKWISEEGKKLNFCPDCYNPGTTWNEDKIKFPERTWTVESMDWSMTIEEQEAAIQRAKEFAHELYPDGGDKIETS